MLLKANRGEAGPEWTDGAISTALEVDPTTVARVRKLYVTGGPAVALDRKAPDRVYRRKLDGEQAVAAWVATRNAAVRTIDWRFTTDDARIKLDLLYAVFHDGRATSVTDSVPPTAPYSGAQGRHGCASAVETRRRARPCTSNRVRSFDAL